MPKTTKQRMSQITCQLPDNTILLLKKYAKRHQMPNQRVINDAIINHVKPESK